MRWSKEHMVFQPLIHWGPAWICYLGLLRISLRQKLQNGLSINFFLQNNFEHNKYKKEECHAPYISSFSISNYKTNFLVPQVVIDWRLCNIKVVANWVHRKTFLTCISLSLLAMFSHVVVEGYKKRENEREKEGEAKPSWGTTIKTPCQPGYLPKVLLPNAITLGVKGRQNSIHSSYLFLNQDRLSFHYLFYSLFIFPEVF